MSAAAFAFNFFIALFALIDPVGNVALFAAATPGAISTAIIYASQARAFGWVGAVVGVAVMAAVALSCFVSFLATPIITRLLGKIGMTIVVRVLGLILCAMAVQFLLAGLADSTIGLIRPSAASPYPEGSISLPGK